MNGALLSTVLPLILLIGIYRLALGRGRIASFNPNRARTRSRSVSSPNALLILAAINMATLGFDLAARGDELHLPSGLLSALIPLMLIVGLTLLVLSRSLADALIGGLGISASLLGLLVDHGPGAVVLVLLLATMLVFLLGVFRGFTRP